MKKFRVTVELELQNDENEATAQLRVLDLLDGAVVRPRIIKVEEVSETHPCLTHNKWSCFLCKWSSGRPVEYWLSHDS